MEKWQERFLVVTWPDFVEKSTELSQLLSKRAPQPDIIVAIARGGLTLSQLLSDSLTLPIASFTIQSYKAIQQTDLPRITFELGGSLHNKNVLLVDDVADTGKTFIRGIEYLQELGADKSQITTCSLHYKPHSKFKPDYYAVETDAWVIYPYEVKESIKALSSIWQKEKLPTTEIKRRLATLQLPKKQIEALIS